MLLPFHSLINHCRKINHKHQSQREKNVRIVIIALERRLRFIRFDFRSDIFLGQHISACFFNPACDYFKVTWGIWFRIDSCLKNTHHFIQAKERNPDKKGWHSNNAAEDLFLTSSTTFNIQLLRNTYIYRVVNHPF